MKNKMRARRALHLIDLENQLGGGKYPQQSVEIYQKLYEAHVPQAELDQFYVAANPGVKIQTSFGWTKSAPEYNPGKNGADLLIAEYLEDIDYVKNNFGKVFIASGDGAFIRIVRLLKENAVGVTMVKGLGVMHPEYFALDIPIIDLEDYWNN